MISKLSWQNTNYLFLNIAVVVAMVARQAHNLKTWFESNGRNYINIFNQVGVQRSTN